jgi:DNA-binding NtrC family response regulator
MHVDETQFQRNFSLPIVIVEDDATTLEILCAILRGNGMNPVPFPTGLDAMNYIKKHPVIGALLIDISLPDIDGIELLRQARKLRNCVPGYILTAKNDAESAVNAMKAGATDYFTKPFGHQSLVATMHAALALRSSTPEIYEGAMAYHDRWESPAMKSALADLKQATHSNSPVVIHGSSGVGKSAFARIIHDASNSSEKGFHTVNLAELSEGRVESELFGQSPSNSGSVGGRLKKSKGGTLHLANLHTLSLRAQAALVDWIKQNPPIAAGKSATRIVCSTTADMEELMKAGTFRRDLWYLLSVHRIHVPSLRDRKEDLPSICEEILTSICVKGNLRRPTITRMAMMTIQDYDWPYNIMELHNALQHAVANTQDGLISPADLPRYVHTGSQQADSNKMGEIGLTSIDEVTKASLEAALKACGGNRRRAAQRLQLSLRTVYYMIKRYGLTNTRGSKITTPSNGTL